MTRHSQSRGMLYSTPPADDDGDETEKPADD